MQIKSPFLTPWSPPPTCLIIKWGYTFRFTRRPPRFGAVVSKSVQLSNAYVLHAEVMSLLVKGAVETVSQTQSESGFYSRYFLPQEGWWSKTHSRSQTSESCSYETAVQDDHIEADAFSNMPRGLVIFTRSERRLFSHPDSHPPQAVLEILGVGVAYQYTVLPFGLSLAPCIFTKSIAEICAAAGWASPSTFARFYNLEVPALQAWVLSA